MLLVLPAVYGVRSDPAVEELLKGPDAIEKFKETKGQVQSNNEGQTSPLVKQASEFALYLNPPPPPAPVPPPSPTDIQEAAPMTTVTAKFDLRGTSYYAEHPELSLALIDEPGKGLNWVRQGSTVGHLVIEEVKDGAIIVRDGQKKSEMKVDIKELWRELLKNPAGGSKPGPAAAGVAQPAKPGPADAGRVSIREAKTGAATTPPSRSPIRATSSRRPKPGTEGAIPAATGVSATTARPEAVQPALSGAGSQEQQRDLNQAPPRPGDLRAPEEGQTPDAGEQANPAQGEGEGAATVPPPPLPTEKDIIHIRLMEEVKASRMTEEEAKQIEENIQTIEQLEEIQKQKSEGR